MRLERLVHIVIGYREVSAIGSLRDTGAVEIGTCAQAEEHCVVPWHEADWKSLALNPIGLSRTGLHQGGGLLILGVDDCNVGSCQKPAEQRAQLFYRLV